MLLEKLVNLRFELLSTCWLHGITCLLAHHMLVENLHKLLIFRFKLNSKELLFFIIAFERLVEDVQEDLL